MLIGIDGNEANVALRVGVNVYAYKLLWAIYKMDKDSHEYVVYLKGKPLEDMPPPRRGWEYRVLEGGRLWIITKLMPALFLTKKRPDVFFTPSHYIPPISPMPRICSIMDLGYLEFSGQFKKYDFWQLKLWTAWSIIVSKYIIAISETTKRDIVRHYPFTSKKVMVTPLGYDKEKFNQRVPDGVKQEVAVKYDIRGDYVLFLSTLKPSKNIEGLLDAWYFVKKQFPHAELVIAGKKGWLFDSIFEKVRHLKLTGSVIFTDFVDEADKPALISGSKAFVLPSFWEGFGLDALSALACGVPVVSSNAGSLPEVLDKVGIMVDPKNPQNMALGILKVLKMEKKDYNDLVRKGLTWVARFSWEETAKKTLEVFDNALRG